MKHVVWMFNSRSSESECQWKGCEVKPIVPCRVPEDLRGHVSILEQSTAWQSLPRHAVQTGIFLDAATLVSFARANKVPEPTEGSGALNKSGQRNIIKIDWAKKVVEFFAPDASPERAAFLVDQIMGKKDATKFACPKSILDAVNSLDPENANMPMFRQVKKIAEEQQKTNEQLAARGPV